MAAEKILSVVAAKDRLLASQALVIDLAKEVLRSTDIKGAVRTLVEAAYKVVSADRVSLFLEEDGHLVCHVAPDRSRIGSCIPFSQGIVGLVARTGEAINLTDTSSRPDVFDASLDAASGYTTRSVVCLPLRCADKTIGVLQAVNKKGPGGEPVPFEQHDERMLDLLLALTAQQLRFSELVMQREKATKQAESLLTLVEAVSAERDTVGAATALAWAAVGLLYCRSALVFLREAGSKALVCQAAVSTSGRTGERGLRVELDEEAVLAKVASSGRPALLDTEHDAQEFGRLVERLMPCFGDRLQMEASSASSALCAPLPETKTGEVIGVVVAIDRLLTLGDVEDAQPSQPSSPSRTPTPPSPDLASGSQRPRAVARRFCPSKAMGSLLRRKPSVTVGMSNDAEVGPFSPGDLDTVGVLLRSAVNILRTANLYDQEVRLHGQLGALVDLLTRARSLAENAESSTLVAFVSDQGRKIFDCDRCTFFTVDNFNAQQLVGCFVLPTKEGEEEKTALYEIRVPLKGIVGHVAKTKRPINIKDAWSDPIFSRETDLKTGYRTKTVLCAPMITSNGRMVGVIQCINKNGGHTFGADDLEMLNMVSLSISDVVQKVLLQNSYDTFIRSDDNISSDVKDMFRFYENGAKAAAPKPPIRIAGNKQLLAVVRFKSMGSRSSKLVLPEHMGADNRGQLEVFARWDADLRRLQEDSVAMLSLFQAVYQRLHLESFRTSPEALHAFLKAMQAKYTDTPYHCWDHAVSAWHMTFLLVDSPAFVGLLPPEDVLGVLLAAVGHDVGHPGTNNNFQVNSMSNVALRYNDFSVLENHHASVTCTALQEEQPNLLANLELSQRQRLRQVVINSILNTDMIKHKDAVAFFETSKVDLPGHRRRNEPLPPDACLKLGSALLHSADLGHPALPWKAHKRMSLLIAEEFYTQHQEETRLGLPTLPFMGKDPNNLRELAPIQVGFLQFVARPLWSAMSFAAGQDTLSEVVENIAGNMRRWEELAAGEEVPDDQPYRRPKQRSICPPPSHAAPDLLPGSIPVCEA
uniref:Phosphodiesterase n=1 Tax=Alexandrium monilatum TaxID=311494 RepID=A0A7S4T1X7_9DINO|mmetsp:Transcript_73241/g.231304  ORF Transcript_73241/g.231304 Transcript_73241/m.231304 type:complete len:1038 (-) Transcript_73241:151-3264(-)